MNNSAAPSQQTEHTNGFIMRLHAPKGDSATLTLEGLYEFSTGPAPNAKGSIGLVKEGGQWKVDNGSWSSR